MKKYTKLLLVAGAISSFLCFLVYKYRYDRLYSVMQVLEVFGSPEDVSCTDKSLSRSSPQDFPLSVPYWKGLEGGLEVYSAYCSPSAGESGPCPLVTALAITPGAGSTVPQFRCAAWYEGSLKPLEGVFSFAVEGADLPTPPPVRLLRVSCEVKFPTKIPYGVSFYSAPGMSPEGREGQIVAVEPPTSPSGLQLRGLHICVLPPPFLLPDQLENMKSSLAFHGLVGVSRMTLYAPVLPHSLHAVIKGLHAHTGLQVKWHPWTPSLQLDSSLTLNLVGQDCYQQSRGSFQNYLVLEPHQVLMPRTVGNLSEFLLAQKDELAAGAQPLSVRRFCAEYPNDKKAANLGQPLAILQSTYYSKQLSLGLTASLQHLGPGPPTRNSLAAASGPTAAAVSNELTVNAYGPCDTFDFSQDRTSVYDASAHRFFKDLVALTRKIK